MEVYPLDNETLLLLDAYATSRELALRDQLVRRLTPAMRHTIAKFFNRGVDHDLIWAAGLKGIRQAVEEFTPASRQQFWRLLNQQVVRSIREGFIEHGYYRGSIHMRVPLVLTDTPS